MQALTEDVLSFEWNALYWEHAFKTANSNPPRFLGMLASAILSNARALEGTELRLREGLLVDSSVFSAVANLRIQSRLFFLTVLALALAALSLYLSWRALERDPAQPGGTLQSAGVGGLSQSARDQLEGSPPRPEEGAATRPGAWRRAHGRLLADADHAPGDRP